MKQDKERIEFIDLAKGICILIVVLMHCQIEIGMLQMLRMPLYFVLSGIFFKMYNGLDDFIIRKINKLIAPFLFFYIAAYTVFYVLSIFAPSLLITKAHGIMDVFTQRELCNTPIWFLSCLFWSNILFFSACTISKERETLLFPIVILLSCLGYVSGQHGIFVPLFFDAALTSMPFFYFGYFLKNNSLILKRNKYDQWNAVFIVLLCGLFYWVNGVFKPGIDFFRNMVQGGLSAYFSSFCLILAFLLLCKMIRSIPFISYVGRYSIIILCTHMLVYRAIKLIAKDDFSNYAVFGSTIIILYFLIPICIKYIPYFVAQKDIIRPKLIQVRLYEENKRCSTNSAFH